MCTTFILICLACTYFVCCNSFTTPEPVTINLSEYITFAIQWKPQFCYKNTAPNCHIESIPNITIHGIWPNSYSGSHPSYCSDTKLQTKDVETIQEELEIYWPTLSNSNTNFGFWSHEWHKHGTCWYSVNTTQYFQYGILWMKNESYKHIQNILATNGIYASNENEYSLQNVTNSLNTGLNQKSVVRCKNGRYISEFFVCRQLNGSKKDCPNNLLSNCNDNVVLSLQVLPDTLPPTTPITTTIITYNYNLTATIWINELHYDNIGTDINEFVEIAGIAGTDLSDYTIYLYNGANGQQYSILSFDKVTVIPDQQNGIGTVFIPIATNGIQNGGPDGIALVYYNSYTNSKYVVQFLSYEGQFIARDGPANGMESVDIVVFEGSNTIINTSLSLIGSGYKYEDFEWKGSGIVTYGRINIGQIITPEPTFHPTVLSTHKTTYSDSISESSDSESSNGLINLSSQSSSDSDSIESVVSGSVDINSGSSESSEQSQFSGNNNGGKRIITNENSNGNILNLLIIISIILCILIGIGVGFYCYYNKYKQRHYMVHNFDFDANEEIEQDENAKERLTEFAVTFDDECDNTKLNVNVNT